MRSNLFALSGLLALAACGAGGGMAVAPIAATPPPTAPAPSPAPTPAPAPSYDLAADRSRDRSLEGIGAGTSGVSYSVNANPAAVLPSELKQQFSNRGPIVTYDAAARTYTVQLNGERDSFGPSDILNEDERGVVMQRGNDIFGVVKPSLEYRYLSIVRWDSSSEAIPSPRGFVYTRVSRYAVVGSPTTFSNLPRSGSATYRAIFVGAGFGPGVDNGAYTGDAILTTDFAAGRLSMDMPLAVPNPFTMRLSATIASGANAIAGTITSPDSPFRGDFSGAFYGPAAIELGGIVQLSNGSNAGISGVLTGWRQTRF